MRTHSLSSKDLFEANVPHATPASQRPPLWNGGVHPVSIWQHVVHAAERHLESIEPDREGATGLGRHFREAFAVQRKLSDRPAIEMRSVRDDQQRVPTLDNTVAGFRHIQKQSVQ